MRAERGVDEVRLTSSAVHLVGRGDKRQKLTWEANDNGFAEIPQ